MASSTQHWDQIYEDRKPDELSWYQPHAAVSLALIDALGVPPTAPVIDVGGGASTLADDLLARGFNDITVVDLSWVALARTAERLGGAAAHLDLRCGDILSWRANRRYGLWHDRAVFHFLLRADDRARYVRQVRSSLGPDGAVVIGTFASDGPGMCSGLPVMQYDAARLAAQFGDDFETVVERREEHVTPGGVVQPYTWVGLKRRNREG